ncbi:MAG: glycoside hydrolase family 78 protein [Clostridia bacterium]|nr:glycoside hydrolase family 78 protein [Clostridia bacterium]
MKQTVTLPDARWLEVPCPHDRCPVCAVITFRLPPDASDARLSVTGLGLYRAFLNGERVGDDYLTPGCQDYDAAIRVNEYPVDGLVHPEAENRLTVWLGDGWYRGRWGIDKPPASGDRVFGDRCLLRAALTVRTGAGRVMVLSTSDADSWEGYTVPLLATDIYDGEIWDYTRAPAPLGPCRPAGGRLPERVLPFFGAPVRVREILYPTVLHTPAGETVLDYGVNIAGFVRVSGVIPPGRTLTLTYGELLQHDCFYRGNLRTAKARFICTGDGEPHVIEPYFTYFGFRYVRVEGLTEAELDDLCFEGVVLSSAGERTLSCTTDHPGLNTLMDNVWRSQRANFMDIPTDCPQRDERLGWTADARIFAPTACMNTDCRAFYEKYLFDLRVEQTRYFDGDVPMYAPSLRGEGGPGGAGWADAAVLVPWTLFFHYGEMEQLARDYPLMRDYAERLLEREQGRGLIRGAFTFGDWLSGDGLSPQSLTGATDPDFITGAFLFRVLTVMAEAAAQLHWEDDTARYAGAADRVKAAFLDEYCAPSGRLCVTTQTAYVLSLAFGLYRDREPIVRDLKERLTGDLGKMKTGFLGTPYLLPVLFENGLGREAWRILCSREAPGWLYEVGLGATSVWERWNSVGPDGVITGTAMNSLNHYAYGSVCEAIWGYVGGLRAASPGWTAAVIAPHPSWQMKRFDLSLRTPQGEYRTAWRTSADGVFTLTGCVPPSASAVVMLPDGQRFTDVTGTFSFRTSAPLSRLVRPYGLDTPLLDLAADSAASDVLMRLIPEAWRIVTGPNPDFLTHTLRFLPTLRMFGVTEDVLPALEAALASVTPTVP